MKCAESVASFAGSIGRRAFRPRDRDRGWLKRGRHRRGGVGLRLPLAHLEVDPFVPRLRAREHPDHHLIDGELVLDLLGRSVERDRDDADQHGLMSNAVPETREQCGDSSSGQRESQRWRPQQRAVATQRRQRQQRRRRQQQQRAAGSQQRQYQREQHRRRAATAAAATTAAAAAAEGGAITPLRSRTF